MDSVILTSTNPEKIHHNIICSEELVNSEPTYFCMMGTMIGTYGDNAPNIHKNIADLANIKKAKHKENSSYRRPLKGAKFYCPGYINCEPNWDNVGKLRALYPICCRVTAGLILISLYESYKEELDFLLDSNRIDIEIKFKPVDEMFPAIHLWEGTLATVICSAGYNDRNLQHKPGSAIKSIFSAVPVALVIRKQFNLFKDAQEHPCDLSSTLERIRKQFNDDWDSNPVSSEKWSLTKGKNSGYEFTINNIIKLREHELIIQMLEDQHEEEKKFIEALSKKDSLVYAEPQFKSIVNKLEDWTLNQLK